MNYNETIKYLYDHLPAFHRIGKAAYKNDLENTIALDDYFGHPHKKFRCIHIGGTNGKGSVSHMLASVLMEAGYRTALYTSPHLKDFRERIRVNGKMIPKRSVTRFVKKHEAFINSLNPSFFEMTVAMAFDHFAEEGVDIAVIEVGLGGRLDSTNIITPLLSVITNIGHDHMDLLGDTPEKVAYEKAGIIKAGIPVVIGETGEETKGVFISKALDTGSPVTFADRDFLCLPGDFNYRTLLRRFEMLEIGSGITFKGETPLGGNYQAKNLQTLFGVMKCLKGILKISPENIIEGIRRTVVNTGLMGRWQIISHKPLTICDTGHNREGLEYVLNQIAGIPKTRLHIVIGFVNDKDLPAILPLFPSGADYYFTKASVPRALDERLLMQTASEAGLNGRCFPGVKLALKAARAEAADSDLIFIGGSTFIVAEAL